MLKYLFLIVLFMAENMHAQESKALIFESTSGEVTFVSEAPLETIEANSMELRGMIRASDRTFAFTLLTQSFLGFNSPLQQEHFYENYMESDIFPKASFSGKLIEDINFTEDGKYKVRAKGKLDIHGITKERVIKVDLTIKNGIITATSEFIVLPRDFNISIPKMVWQKISDQINVSVKLEFTARN